MAEKDCGLDVRETISQYGVGVAGILILKQIAKLSRGRPEITISGKDRSDLNEWLEALESKMDADARSNGEG